MDNGIFRSSALLSVGTRPTNRWINTPGMIGAVGVSGKRFLQEGVLVSAILHTMGSAIRRKISACTTAYLGISICPPLNMWLGQQLTALVIDTTETSEVGSSTEKKSLTKAT